MELSRVYTGFGLVNEFNDHLYTHDTLQITYTD
jgi:hypothetical protein